MVGRNKYGYEAVEREMSQFKVVPVREGGSGIVCDEEDSRRSGWGVYTFPDWVFGPFVDKREAVIACDLAERAFRSGRSKAQEQMRLALGFNK